MENLITKFNHISKTKKLGHAYLIYDTKYDDIYDDLNSIVTKYFIKSNKDINNEINVFIIESEKNNIVKEQILELQSNISLKSQINENIVYIIKECDKLNDYAANSLLKTLEEPEDNIYAFLITNNLEKVKSTIKSRCILLKVSEQDLRIEEMYNEDFIDKSLEVIELFENNIYENEADIYNKMKDFTRDEVIDFFTILNFYYKDCLNDLENKKLEYFNNYSDIIELNNNTKSSLIKKILLINKEIEKLYYNINLNLFLDSFIIKYVRC